MIYEKVLEEDEDFDSEWDDDELGEDSRYVYKKLKPVAVRYIKQMIKDKFPLFGRRESGETYPTVCAFSDAGVWEKFLKKVNYEPLTKLSMIADLLFDNAGADDMNVAEFLKKN